MESTQLGRELVCMAASRGWNMEKLCCRATLLNTTATPYMVRSRVVLVASSAGWGLHVGGAGDWCDVNGERDEDSHSMDLNHVAAHERAEVRHTDMARRYRGSAALRVGDAFAVPANDNHLSTMDRMKSCAHIQPRPEELELASNGDPKPSGLAGHRPHNLRRSPHFLVTPVDDDVDAGCYRWRCVVWRNVVDSSQIMRPRAECDDGVGDAAATFVLVRPNRTDGYRRDNRDAPTRRRRRSDPNMFLDYCWYRWPMEARLALLFQRSPLRHLRTSESRGHWSRGRW